ncbi:hypothetical protein RFI_29340 [Reticulomyxa filosa]|uniref:Uncharacterized protein n=1 Tax=Reticulomyxa filosa TaxID=46433 RepID=X6M4T3_RETFI|nr:hypothetical protein RFI_29340 [Reticulomyxa filosa]|eukprot:ETO08050.1 hypothetical protein RFI_29340 [Reticulomyxa filosa]
MENLYLYICIFVYCIFVYLFVYPIPQIKKQNYVNITLFVFAHIYSLKKKDLLYVHIFFNGKKNGEIKKRFNKKEKKKKEVLEENEYFYKKKIKKKKLINEREKKIK